MKKALLFVVLLSLVSCKKKDDPDIIPSGSIPDITGTYSGSYSTSLVPSTTVSITFSQSNTALTGTFNIGSGAGTGTLTGAVGTSSFSFNLAETVPCSGTFNGNGNINGTNLTGSFTGTDCAGTHTGGIFNINKQ